MTTTMTNDLAYYPLTRRKLVERLRDIKRTVKRAQTATEDRPRLAVLLRSAIRYCELARADLDTCRETSRMRKVRRRR